ncbi:ABC transporter ATP-binding protein [Paenibacillus sp. GCM10012306]|uniref:ABC transporter ATP-binding protein n=1 Tax=Paenibacillus sp. GCM10012306 TaxID=3317342 RepID=UPI0036140804
MKAKWIVSNIREVFTIILRQNPLYLLFSVLQIATTIIQPFISIFLFKYLLDTLDHGDPFSYSVRIILLFLIISLVNSNLRIVADNFTKLYAKNQMIPMSMMFCKKAVEMDYQNIENPEIANEINRAVNVLLNKDHLEHYLGSINSICISFGQLLITMVIMSKMNVLVLMTIGAVTLLNYLIHLKAQQRNHETRKEIAPVDREWRYLTSLTHDSSFGKAVRVFGLDQFLMHKIEGNRKRFIAIRRRMANRDFSSSFWVDILNVVQEAIIFLWLVFSVIYNGLSLGNFSLIFNSSQQLTESFSTLSNGFVKLYQNNNYINDFFSFLCREERLRKGGSKFVDWEGGTGILELDHVSFRYPGSDRYAIKDLNLIIAPGERITIVGDNGAGKTTLVKLIMRLYDVTEGEIRYNGMNIKQYDYDEYLSVISTVFQDYKILAASIYENIALNDVNEADKAKLDEILINCGLMDKVKSLPAGGETLLSRVYDQEGVELSEGQKQSIALGRALYKEAPVVILDEPTASLSPMAERDLYARFDELTQGKTVIYISHRLSSAQISDKICVIHDGMLAEYGSHEELIGLNGIYAKMFTLQSKYYETA